MQTIETSVGKSYAVTTSTECTISTPQGVIIAVCPVGQQTVFIAPTDTVIVSVDDAHVTETFKGAASSASGGGNASVLSEHISDGVAHLSAEEHRKLKGLISSYGEVAPPATALSYESIEAYFEDNAQPGVTSAPSAVYLSRVPWARWEGDSSGGQWVNNESEVDEAVFGVPRKLMDNAGLRHEFSTDTVAGVDDYNGLLWPFFWSHGNFVRDKMNVKYVSAVKGSTIDLKEFDESLNTCAFGPAFWFICKLEHSCDSETGVWRTHDGTETGTPLFQLWGISTRPWDELDERRRAELAALGVTESDLHLWPSCYVWDYGTRKRMRRNYWVHAAYQGTRYVDSSLWKSSVAGCPAASNASLSKIEVVKNSSESVADGFNGYVRAMALLFFIVKNASKRTKNFVRGCEKALPVGETSAYTLKDAGALFPVSQPEAWNVGDAVMVTTKPFANDSVPDTENSQSSLATISSIESRQLTLADGELVEQPCLVLNLRCGLPMKVCSTQADAAAAGNAGVKGVSFVGRCGVLTGESNAVLGKHDGACVSLTDGQHPFRIQGTEFGVGYYEIMGDMIRITGDGVTSLKINGQYEVPSTSDAVFLVKESPWAQQAATNELNTLSKARQGGWKVVHVAPISKLKDYIVNAHITPEGYFVVDGAGGAGSSALTGFGENSVTNELISASTVFCGLSRSNSSHTGIAYTSSNDSFLGSWWNRGFRP